jgi:hypothetical protein
VPSAGAPLNYGLLGLGLAVLVDWTLGSPLLHLAVFTPRDRIPGQRRAEVVLGVLLIVVWLGASGLALLGIRL